MWESLVTWARQFMGLVVTLAVAGLLLPESPVRGVVRTVMGVTLVVAVLAPLSGVLEDLGAWQQALARWQTSGEPALQASAAANAAPLLEPGAEGAMAAAAWQGAEQRLARFVREAAGRAGYRADDVRLSGMDGPDGEWALRVVARPSGPVAPIPARNLAAYLAALVGIDEAQVEVELVR